MKIKTTKLDPRYHMTEKEELGFYILAMMAEHEYARGNYRTFTNTKDALAYLRGKSR